MHATARAVSGSSVYVSDFPGIHDIDLLRRLVLPDGRVLRALLPGRPTRDSLFCDVLRDNRSLLKVRLVIQLLRSCRFIKIKAWQNVTSAARKLSALADFKNSVASQIWGADLVWC